MIIFRRGFLGIFFKDRTQTFNFNHTAMIMRNMHESDGNSLKYAIHYMSSLVQNFKPLKLIR